MYIVFISTLVIMLIFCIFSAIYLKHLHNLNKNADFLHEIKFSPTLKPTFIHLKKSCISENLFLSFQLKNKLFCLNKINSYEKFLLTIARLSENKINLSKQTFRSSNNLTIIEQVSKCLLYQTIISNKPIIFKGLKNYSKKFNLRQKEHKVFNFILSNDILLEIIEIKNELDKLFKITQKAKHISKLNENFDTIYFYAQVYGVSQFNQNRNKLITFSKQEECYMIKKFFEYLYDKKKKLDILLAYLLAIYN